MLCSTLLFLFGNNFFANKIKDYIHRDHTKTQKVKLFDSVYNESFMETLILVIMRVLWRLLILFIMRLVFFFFGQDCFVL